MVCSLQSCGGRWCLESPGLWVWRMAAVGGWRVAAAASTGHSRQVPLQGLCPPHAHYFLT